MNYPAIPLSWNHFGWSRAGSSLLCTAVATALVLLAASQAVLGQAPLPVSPAKQVRDHYVALQSSAPSMPGEYAQLYVRERLADVSLSEDGKGQVVLFIHGAGAYSSGGRVAVVVGAALLGVSLPTGGQQVYASLVDLKTGKVVWFNVAVAAPGADMRDPEGARVLVGSMLKDVPL